MPQFPDPLNSWFGWVWMAALCLSGLFLSLDGCEPKHPSAHAAEFSANEWTKGVVIIKPASLNASPTACLRSGVRRIALSPPARNVSARNTRERLRGQSVRNN